MPLYEYRCTACGHHFDHWFPTFQAAETEPTPSCPACGASEVRRLFSRVAVHSGSGDAPKDEGETAPAEEKPKVFGRKELNEIMEQRRSLGID